MKIFLVSDTVPNFVRKMLLKHSSPPLLCILSYKDFFSDINRKASCENISPAKIVFCVQALIGFTPPSLSNSTETQHQEFSQQRLKSSSVIREEFEQLPEKGVSASTHGEVQVNFKFLS